MSWLGDLKKFVLRGNLVDLAVGFTVGAAFTTIARSLVDDVVMPAVGLLLGRSDFSDFFWILKEGAKAPAPYVTLADAREAGAVTVNYGLFVNSVLTFLVVALAMFLVIRLVSRLDRTLEARYADPPRPEEPDDKKCPYCRSTIAHKATRCPHCTSHLEASGTGPSIPAGASPAQ